MKKKKKLFEPIRRGAPSLPFDFTEELKKMEITYSYPKQIEENDFRKTSVYVTKKYRFDYIKEDVMKWAPEVRKAMTKQMIYMLPYRISLPFIMPDRIIPAMDYYGEVIDNYDEWKRQREEYIEELYKQLKNGEEYEKDFNS